MTVVLGQNTMSFQECRQIHALICLRHPYTTKILFMQRLILNVRVTLSRICILPMIKVKRGLPFLLIYRSAEMFIASSKTMWIPIYYLLGLSLGLIFQTIMAKFGQKLAVCQSQRYMIWIFKKEKMILLQQLLEEDSTC